MGGWSQGQRAQVRRWGEEWDQDAWYEIYEESEKVKKKENNLELNSDI